MYAVPLLIYTPPLRNAPVAGIGMVGRGLVAEIIGFLVFTCLVAQTASRFGLMLVLCCGFTFELGFQSEIRTVRAHAAN